MLLDWLGERRNAPALISAAAAIERSIDLCVASAETRTGDLGGKLGTSAFAKAVISNLGGPA